MIKKLVPLFIMSLVFMMGCSVKTGKVVRVQLPEGTTIEIANEIIKNIAGDDFGGKIFRKFTNLDPTKHETYLKWEKWPGRGGIGMYITFGIDYRGTLSNVDEILVYGENIVRGAIKNYFKNKT